MLTPEDHEAVAAQTRVLRIIIFSLLAGPLAFLTVVLMQPVEDPPLEGKMTLMAAGFAAIQVVLAVVVPKVVGQMHRRAIVEGRPLGNNLPAPTSDAQGLLAGLQVRRIISAALLESAAFFNIVAYQSERVPFTLAIVLLLLVGIAMLFPLRSFVEDWLDRELRTVNELRALRRKVDAAPR
jgi:hypothetical protein